MTETATTDELTPAAIRERVGPILALDGWSRDRLVVHQRAALRDVLAHAVAHSPYYREALGPDAAEADLADLPTLPKPLLMEQFDRIVTDPALRVDDLRAFLAEAEPSASFEGRYRVFATSGSTGSRASSSTRTPSSPTGSRSGSPGSRASASGRTPARADSRSSLPSPWRPRRCSPTRPWGASRRRGARRR